MSFAVLVFKSVLITCKIIEWGRKEQNMMKNKGKDRIRLNKIEQKRIGQDGIENNVMEQNRLGQNRIDNGKIIKQFPRSLEREIQGRKNVRYQRMMTCTKYGINQEIQKSQYAVNIYAPRMNLKNRNQNTLPVADDAG